MSDWLAGGWWSDTPTILSQFPFFCLCSEEEDVLVKERVAHREREGRASGVLERFYYYYYYFNIVLTWTIVGAPKVSVLYVYIDKIKKEFFPFIHHNLHYLKKKKNSFLWILFT